MKTIRMTDRCSATVTYVTDYSLTDEEMAEFEKLDDGWEKEEFLLTLPAGRETETDEDVNHIDSVGTDFEVVG